MHNGHTVQFNLIWFPKTKNGERITFTKKKMQQHHSHQYMAPIFLVIEFFCRNNQFISIWIFNSISPFNQFSLDACFAKQFLQWDFGLFALFRRPFQIECFIGTYDLAQIHCNMD